MNDIHEEEEKVTPLLVPSQSKIKAFNRDGIKNPAKITMASFYLCLN